MPPATLSESILTPKKFNIIFPDIAKNIAITKAKSTDLVARLFFSSSVISLVSDTNVTTPPTGLTMANRLLNA